MIYTAQTRRRGIERLQQFYRFSMALIIALAAGSPGAAVERGFIKKFCINPPHDALCPQLPFDQADFSSDFNYMLIEKGAQDPFDVFSWQAFVALNWPADSSGNALPSPIGTAPDAPRVWLSYARRDALFGPDRATQACGDKIADTTVLISDLVQSDGSVLVDRNGNFVVFSTYANPVAGAYLRANALTDAAGQETFTRTGTVAFPQGRLADAQKNTGANAPAMTLKMAWRILNPAEINGARFFPRPAVIHVPAARAHNDEAMCAEVTIGLVGMHIAMRTESGNGDEWIWATFEHTDNAPVAANARNVNSIYDDDLFPGGCAAPAKTADLPYSFFDPNCRDCKTNTQTVSDWRWSDAPPFARHAGGGTVKSAQVVRCWDIFESTAAVNRAWQDKLQGTVWANYMLISTQWRATDKSPLFEHGEVPRYLTNLTLETFQQTAKDGTCLGCHATARTVNGHAADFVFMLQRAK